MAGLALASGLLLALLVLVPAGQAAFPGANGRIAFSSGTGDGEIYLMNPDGSNQIPITDNTAGDYSPAWSADGDKILFTKTYTSKAS